MKKFFSSIAIVAFALASVYSFSSCGSDDDDVTPEPDPTPVYFPIESIEGRLVYDYSPEAIELFNIVYEVTDFDGKKDVITVTEPGKVEKTYKAKNITDEATVKLTVTAKDVKAIGTGETFNIKFNSYVYLPTTVKGYTFNPEEVNGFGSTIFTDKVGTAENKHINAVKEIYAGTFEAKLALPEVYRKGVTQEWIDADKKK